MYVLGASTMLSCAVRTFGVDAIAGLTEDEQNALLSTFSTLTGISLHFMTTEEDDDPCNAEAFDACLNGWLAVIEDPVCVCVCVSVCVCVCLCVCVCVCVCVCLCCFAHPWVPFFPVAPCISYSGRLTKLQELHIFDNAISSIDPLAPCTVSGLVPVLVCVRVSACTCQPVLEL